MDALLGDALRICSSATISDSTAEGLIACWHLGAGIILGFFHRKKRLRGFRLVQNARFARNAQTGRPNRIHNLEIRAGATEGSQEEESSNFVSLVPVGTGSGFAVREGPRSSGLKDKVLDKCKRNRDSYPKWIRQPAILPCTLQGVPVRK